MSELRENNTNEASNAEIDPYPKLVLIISEAFEERHRLTEMFRLGGHLVADVAGIAEAEQILASNHVDLVIFDAVHLADAPFQFCVKASARQFPPLIIMAEDRGNFEEIIALELGADAFIQRPAEQRLLLAKSKALIRRYSRPVRSKISESETTPLNWQINPYLQVAISPGGQTVMLSPVELRLFRIFIESPGKIYTQETLAKLLGSGDRKSRHITTSMSRLRRKLAVISEREPIQTVHGIGYVYPA